MLASADSALPWSHGFTGRRKTIALTIALGAGLITVILLLYIGWGLLNWRHGILLVLGILLLLTIIAGVVLNTIFLVHEIRRNEQHDAFINAVTHELKTPVASIRLYLETLQTRPVDEAKRQEFYRIMLADSDRLLATIEQVLRTGRMGAATRKLNLSRIAWSSWSKNAWHAPARSISFRRGARISSRAAGGDSGRRRRSARRRLQPHR